MQADMSSTITQVETLQSYLEQGIEAVMVKDDAILRKQATEKGMVILSQETLEIYQQGGQSYGTEQEGSLSAGPCGRSGRRPDRSH